MKADSRKLGAANIAGSATAGSRGRAEDDFYATPFSATRALCDVETIKGSILEPAAGEGHICKVLRDQCKWNDGYELTATDLVERRDRFDIGITGGIDFLTHDYGRKFDNVVCNPPYAIAEEFVRRALDVTEDYYGRVFMFLKLQFLEGIGRLPLFRETPLETVYVFSKRVSTWRNGEERDENGRPWSTTLCHAWFVWTKGCYQEPRIRWILPKE